MTPAASLPDSRVVATRAAAFLGPALLAFVVDVVSKRWAERALAGRPPVPLLGEWLRLTLGHNTGAAFGLFANGGTGLLVVTSLVIAGLAAWLLLALRRPHPPMLPTAPLGLILGGAVANFLDRLPDGRVTDFLDAGLGALRWPTFNLADTAIVLGLLLLLLAASLADRPGRGAAEVA